MKKIVYLISPNEIKKQFYDDLDRVLSYGNVKFFQLRLKKIKKPIVVIGGFNNINYKRLIKAGAKFIAISSFIWDNPKLKPELAIRKFK